MTSVWDSDVQVCFLTIDMVCAWAIYIAARAIHMACLWGVHIVCRIRCLQKCWEQSKVRER